MKDLKKILVCSLLAVTTALSMSACDFDISGDIHFRTPEDGKSSSSSQSSGSQESSSTPSGSSSQSESSSQSGSSSSQVVINFGTLESPLTVAEAIQTINDNSSKNYSSQDAFVEGIISSVEYDETKGWTIWLANGDTAKGFELYHASVDSKLFTKDDSVDLVGAKVVATGKLYKHVSGSNVTYEYNGNCSVKSVSKDLSVLALKDTNNEAGGALEPEEKVQLSVTGNKFAPEIDTSKVTYHSSNEAVATVSASGEVTAIANGSTVITATYGELTSSEYNLTVNDNIVLTTGINLDKETASLLYVDDEAKSTVTLVATVAPSDATNKSVTFESSNTNVVTVDATGKVVAVGAGTATISAKQGEITKTCAITVDYGTKTIEQLLAIELDNQEDADRDYYVEGTISYIGVSDSTHCKAFAIYDGTNSINVYTGYVSAGNLEIKSNVPTLKMGDKEYKAGDVVKVLGRATNYYGLMQIKNPTLSLVSEGIPSIEEVRNLSIKTLADIPATDKSVYGDHVKIAGKVVVDGNNYFIVNEDEQKVQIFKDASNGYGYQDDLNNGDYAICDCYIYDNYNGVWRIAYMSSSQYLYVTASVDKTVIVKNAQVTDDFATASGEIKGSVTQDSKEWISSDPTVATVDEVGKITPVSVGTTLITYKVNGEYVSDPIEIEVTDIASPVSIAITDSTPSYALNANNELMVGFTTKLSAAVNPVVDGVDQTVTWSSSDETLATVDASGNVTALKAGTVTITAKSTQKDTVVKTYEITIAEKELATSLISLSTNKNLKDITDLEGAFGLYSPLFDISFVKDKGNDPIINSKGYFALYYSASGSNTFTVSIAHEEDGDLANKIVSVKPIAYSSSDYGINVYAGESTEALTATDGVYTIDATSFTFIPTKKSFISGFEIEYVGRAPSMAEINALNISKVINPFEVDYIAATTTPIELSNDYTWAVTAGSECATITDNKLSVILPTTNGTQTTVKVTATAGTGADAKQKEFSFTSTNIKPSTVAISGVTKTTLNAGETLQLSATVTPAFAVQELVWESSDEDKATVDSTGKVTAIAAGSVTITAKSSVDNTIVAEQEFTIQAEVAPSALAYEGATSLEVGKTLDLVVTPTPSNAVKTVTWEITSGGTYATLDGNQLKGVAPGTVVLTATSTKDGTVKAENISIVVDYAPITITPSTATKYDTTGLLDGVTAKYSQTYNTKFQMTSGNSVTYEIEGLTGKKITKIVFSVSSNASKGAGTLLLTAGTTELFSIHGADNAGVAFNNALWNGAWPSAAQAPCDLTRNITVDHTIAENEKVVFTISATANSLYCFGIKVYYE